MNWKEKCMINVKEQMLSDRINGKLLKELLIYSGLERNEEKC